MIEQSYTQKPGIDFEEVFAPVARMATQRTFPTVAAKRNMPVQDFDVKKTSTDLYSVLDEELLMRQSHGFEVPGEEELVCKL